MAKRYIVHPGYVTLLTTGESVFVDAGTLASYYGLDAGDYDTATTGDQQENSNDGNSMHIHLFPREDGKYQSIKTLTADNGTDIVTDKMVGAKNTSSSRPWRKNGWPYSSARRKEIGL